MSALMCLKSFKTENHQMVATALLNKASIYESNGKNQDALDLNKHVYGKIRRAKFIFYPFTHF